MMYSSQVDKSSKLTLQNYEKSACMSRYNFLPQVFIRLFSTLFSPPMAFFNGFQQGAVRLNAGRLFERVATIGLKKHCVKR